MRRMDDVAVFAAVVGFLALTLALAFLLTVKAMAWRECITLGYQDSQTSIGLPIKRVCIRMEATHDEYVPLVVARAFARH